MKNKDTPALTEFAEIHGCSCKVDQDALETILVDVGLDQENDELLLGVGDDAAATRITEDMALVSTIDFFTPIVDDPFDFGRIAACNAASDAFATGAIDRLGCLVVLGLPRELTDQAAPILRGMRTAIEGMGGNIVGGHTVLNPWPLAGGAVHATANPDTLLSSGAAEPGDTLYLTKPLGTQPAMGAMRVRGGEFETTVREATTRPIEEIADEAIAWMTTPNRHAARVARGYANAGTDITGFGLAGQATHVATRSGVGIELTDLPVIAGSPPLSDLFGYGLRRGESAETSGGLLVSVPEGNVDGIEREFEAEAVFYRRVGIVKEGEDVTVDDPTIEPISIAASDFPSPQS